MGQGRQGEHGREDPGERYRKGRGHMRRKTRRGKRIGQKGKGEKEEKRERKGKEEGKGRKKRGGKEKKRRENTWQPKPHY